MNSNKTNDEITNIQENIDVKEVPKENPYWDYINMKLIQMLLDG